MDISMLAMIVDFQRLDQRKQICFGKYGRGPENYLHYSHRVISFDVPFNPIPMNAFITTVMINELAADYKVFPIGKKFKAVLMQAYLGNCLPCQVEFWKDKGNWKTHHPLTEAVINQFGNLIDGHLQAEQAGMKNSTAA